MGLDSEELRVKSLIGTDFIIVISSLHYSALTLHSQLQSRLTMPTFISDPPLGVYLFLALGTIVGFAVWVNKRNRASLIVFGCFLSLLALVFLLDRIFESPREQSIRRVNEMAKAIDDRNKDAFLSHVADSFQYQGEGNSSKTFTHDELRKSPMWSALNQFGVNHVAAWDFTRDDFTEVNENTIEIGFLGKAVIEGKDIPMYFRARFTRQADGQMKLTSLASYDPMKRVNERKGIPNFP